MSNLGSLLSGQIQLSNGNNTSNYTNSTNSTAKTTTSTAPVVSDINISPVGSSIDPSLYTYDGQTTLYINSTVNQNNNSVQLQYFDPSTGYPNTNTSPYGYPSPMSSGFTNWNFDQTPQNILNGCVTSSNMFCENTYLYDNLQPPISTPNYLGLHSIDITDANTQTNSSGNSSNTMFFSLTSQPYLCYQGVMYNAPGSVGVPTYQNINPNYSTLGTDTFMFTSQYWVQTSNEIMNVQLVFNISNTASTYFSPTTSGGSSTSSSPAPIITVIVYNKIITRDMLASIGTGNTCPKPKVYSTGVISLQYQQPGQQFNSGVPTYYLFNNVPLIIADGYKKSFGTFGVYYIPPSNTTISSVSYQNYCQFLAGSDINGDGYTIKSNLPTADILNINLWTGSAFPSTTGIGIIGSTQAPTFTQYGHFVVSVAYSYNASQYSPGTAFTAEVLIKNIWRSPIAIYNAYSAFSVNDLVNKQVVLLFGKSSNGGTFLVTNTGTSLAQVSNYGVTSLGNFMLIFKTILSSYDNTYTLADYFINTTLINNLNTIMSINIQAVLLQPVLEGTIINPSSVMNCPNMWYMFLNNKNSVNLSIDPTYQDVFNSNSSLYLGLSGSTLCDTGLCRYFNNELTMLGTTNNTTSTLQTAYFGNSIYLGLNSINNQYYYMLIILPEALFNGTPVSVTNNVMSIYASLGTIFYFNFNSSSSSAFVPSGNSVSNTTPYSSSSSSGSVNNSYNVSKVILPVSNVQLL